MGGGVCDGEYMGHGLEDEPLTLLRCHSCGMLHMKPLGGNLSVAEPTA